MFGIQPRPIGKRDAYRYIFIYIFVDGRAIIRPTKLSSIITRALFRFPPLAFRTTLARPPTRRVPFTFPRNGYVIGRRSPGTVLFSNYYSGSYAVTDRLGHVRTDVSAGRSPPIFARPGAFAPLVFTTVREGKESFLFFYSYAVVFRASFPL